MIRATLLHGFRVSDGGEATIGRIAPYLTRSGMDVRRVDYGRFSFGRVRLANRPMGAVAAAMAEAGDVIVAHSNGCTIAAEAAERSTRPLGLVFLQPALDRDWEPPEAVTWLHVYHNAADKAVSAARWLPWHPWGAMGRDGYTGHDPRVVNIDTGRGDPDIRALGHSAIFEPGPVLRHWGRYIARQVSEALADHPAYATEVQL